MIHNANYVESSGSISFIGRIGGHGILRLQESFLTRNDLNRASIKSSHSSGRIATLHRDRSMSVRSNGEMSSPGFVMVPVQLPLSVRSIFSRGMRVQMTIRPQAPDQPAWVANVDGEDAILTNDEQDSIVIPVRYQLPQHGMRYEILLFPVESRSICRLINTRIPLDQDSFEFSEPSQEVMQDESRIQNQ